MLQLDLTHFPTLHTERLVLRQAGPADVEPLFRIRSDERTMQFLARRQATTMSEVEEMLMRMEEERITAKSLSWMLSLREDGTMVGSIGLYRIKPEHHCTEVGYQLAPEHWGRGLMHEALNAVTAYGLGPLAFHRLEAMTDPRNERSRALLERCGYELEGIQRENYYWEGRYMDSAIYARLAGHEHIGR
jgi:ribosomal-protein-alanine N-acetyltransferase